MPSPEAITLAFDGSILLSSAVCL